MWQRKDLKSAAKRALKKNYWGAVAAALINTVFLALVGRTFSSGGGSDDALLDEWNAYVSGMSEAQLMPVLLKAFGIILAASAVMWIIDLLVKILVVNPFKVGVSRYYVLCHTEEKPSLKELVFGFHGSWGNIVLVMFLCDLFTWLWSLLFLIPGIIKGYQWMLVPYILAENPGMSPKVARDLSRSMMEGNKWRAFTIWLSFLGWFLLSIVTFGIADLFYVEPYYELTMAEFYRTLKAQTR